MNLEIVLEETGDEPTTIDEAPPSVPAHLADTYRFLGQGGYGTVFKHCEEPIVVKRLPKYHDDGVNPAYTSVMERIVAETLSMATDANHLNVSLRQTSDDAYAYVYYPYHGESLHDWIRTTPMLQRREHAFSIIWQLARGCQTLLANGLQHTDLKPANVIVRWLSTPLSKEPHVVLIDWNCVSCRRFQGCKTPPWTASLGSYAYSAPEIVASEQPHDHSMVWSLAMLFMECYWEYPIGPSMVRYIHFNLGKLPKSLKGWQELHTLCKSTSRSNDVPYFVFDGIRTPKAWKGTAWRWLRKALCWNPQERLSLDDFLQYVQLYTIGPPSINLAEGPASLPTPPPPIDAVADPMAAWCDVGTVNARQIFLPQLYKFLEKVKCHTDLAWVTWLLERFMAAYDGEHDAWIMMPTWAMACWWITMVLRNSYIYDHTYDLKHMTATWHVSTEAVESWFWKIGDALDWRVYGYHPSIQAIDQWKNKHPESGDTALEGLNHTQLHALMALKGPYTLKDVVGEMIEWGEFAKLHIALP